MDLTRVNLGINGGIPVRTKPWLDNLTMGQDEMDAVEKVLVSGYLSLFEGSHTPDHPFSFWGGPFVQRFEEQWAEYYKMPYAVSMNSATSCLYAAIGALGIGYGDEIIVSPYTMSACATGALVYGAIPVFADVEEDTGCLNPVSIEERITPRTKAILLVHQFGIPAEMKKIMKLAKKYNLKIIEDCAQAHGAMVGDKYVGTFGDIGVFSLNVNKTIQTGEGGICVTNNEELRYRLALIRNHGEVVVEEAGVEDITNIIGFNYRLTELQAAIGIEQLKKLEYLNQKRIEYASMLAKEIEKYDCLKPLYDNRAGIRATYYLFSTRYLKEVGKTSREEFVAAINAEGIKFFQGYTRPLYLQPVYQKKHAFKHGYPFSAPENADSKPNYKKGNCPVSERLHFKEMMINEHVRPPNTKADVKDIVKAIEKVLK